MLRARGANRRVRGRAWELIACPPGPSCANTGIEESASHRAQHPVDRRGIDLRNARLVDRRGIDLRSARLDGGRWPGVLGIGLIALVKLAQLVDARRSPRSRRPSLATFAAASLRNACFDRASFADARFDLACARIATPEARALGAPVGLYEDIDLPEDRAPCARPVSISPQRSPPAPSTRAPKTARSW